MKFEHMEKNSARIEWMELAQIISMLFIVFHHSLPNYTSVVPVAEAFANTVHIPALAVFFFFSGYWSISWKKKGYFGYITQRAVRLLIPWIVLSVIMMIPKAALSNPESREAMRSVQGVAMMLVDPHRHGVLPHLWFLPALFIMTLFVYPWERACTSRSLSAIGLFSAFLLTCLPYQWTTILCINRIKNYLFWYLLGYYIHRNNKHINVSHKGLLGIMLICNLITVAVILLMETNTLSRILVAVFGMPGILSFSSYMETRMKWLTGVFRGKTFCIYLLSMCAQNFAEVFLSRMDINGNISMLIMFAVGLAVPMLVYWSVMKLEQLSNHRSVIVRTVLGI